MLTKFGIRGHGVGVESLFFVTTRKKNSFTDYVCFFMQKKEYTKKKIMKYFNIDEREEYIIREVAKSFDCKAFVPRAQNQYRSLTEAWI